MNLHCLHVTRYRTELSLFPFLHSDDLLAPAHALLRSRPAAPLARAARSARGGPAEPGPDWWM